ncbi:MAG: twin-arginine translocase subunit TatC [Deltaproteobacteria bacterium]|nr:twin-arginine translocase subunit TatC [Deltaproteobacteria bacterium]
MTLWEHLAELRRRLIYCLLTVAAGCLLAWEGREQILAFLVKPFADAWRAKGIPGQVTLHFATPGAAFVAYFELAMLGGFLLSTPMLFYQAWRFVAPGLYAREKRYVVPFVLSSTVLFVGGGLFGWRAAFPIAFEYFLSLSGTLQGQGVAIVPTVMMGDYLSFVAFMLLAFGIVFEIPVFILFLALAGIVNYLHLIYYGRWFVLGAFIVAAIVTPPDVTSQVLVAIPMCVLYAASIVLAYFFGPKPTAEQRRRYSWRKKRAQAEAGGEPGGG